MAHYRHVVDSGILEIPDTLKNRDNVTAEEIFGLLAMPENIGIRIEMVHFRDAMLISCDYVVIFEEVIN
jgi:hypothetical protein